MKGREEGAGRAAMPPWLRQGDGAVSLHGVMGVLCSQPPASQQKEVGGGSSSPGTLRLLQQLSFKGYLWLFSHSSSQEELCSSTAGSSGLPLALK